VSSLSDTQDIPRHRPGAAAPGARPAPSAEPGRFASGRSTLEVKDGIWHLRARECGYRETGLAIGRLLAASGYPAVRVFGSRHGRLIVGLLYAMTRRDFRRIRIPECYLEELDGYAEGAGLPYETLFFMNFVFDILKKYGFHCSSVAFAGSGATLVGRNTDLIPWIAKVALKWFPPVVLDIRIPGTLRYVHVTPGLFLGVLGGFNERGLAMMSHQIAATREKPVAGNLATPLLQRMILEGAADMAQTESVIHANPVQRCISNLVTSAAEGRSCVYEITPASIRATRGSGPFLCCATHFKDSEFSLLHRRKTTISERRLELMNRLAAETRPLPDEVIAILGNCDNGVAHRTSGYSPANEGTYQSIVFDVSGGRLFVSDGTRLPVSRSGAFREIVLGDG
jgi:predicted choloylglycine hydrolase